MASMNYSEYVKKQVSKDDWRILQKLNVVLDSRILSDIWTDFVNFEARKRRETPFILDKLKEYKKPYVFDACLGSGSTTLGLKLEGITDVVSNEIDKSLARIAISEAARLGQKLTITPYDWRNISDKYSGKFNAVLCLGNSLTYLFKKKDQIKALRNFRKILAKDGQLIIDERNYEYHFLGGKYKFSSNSVYCGKEKVSAQPIYVSRSMVVMEYKHKDTGMKAHLVMYPFKEGELKNILKESGFSRITAYGDYKKRYEKHKPEFITYCCKE